ncbi:hypothetical protein Ab1vBOLIVR2_gp26c [Agrobacterium phage OLIVR2]|nr:hypothetical protein Ab1vBOLIVR2_gp26c [Agrobacterium phage OLIVR2]QIW87436.1 hypothetical protein Ab1vBOLIVR3_gp26c [Agrobacterium phage OLIVR3]
MPKILFSSDELETSICHAERVAFAVNDHLVIDTTNLDGQRQCENRTGFQFVTQFLNFLQEFITCRLKSNELFVLATDVDGFHGVDGEAQRQIDELTVRFITDVHPRLCNRTILLRAVSCRTTSRRVVACVECVENAHDNLLNISWLGRGLFL